MASHSRARAISARARSSIRARLSALQSSDAASAAATASFAAKDFSELIVDVRDVQRRFRICKSAVPQNERVLRPFVTRTRFVMHAGYCNKSPVPAGPFRVSAHAKVPWLRLVTLIGSSHPFLRGIVLPKSRARTSVLQYDSSSPDVPLYQGKSPSNIPRRTTASFTVVSV